MSHLAFYFGHKTVFWVIVFEIMFDCSNSEQKYQVMQHEIFFHAAKKCEIELYLETVTMHGNLCSFLLVEVVSMGLVRELLIKHSAFPEFKTSP